MLAIFGLNAPRSGVSYADPYDDDPSGAPGSPFYHVSPNLDDDPLKTASAFVFINDPPEVLDVEHIIRSQSPGPIGSTAGTVVFNEKLRDIESATGPECVDALDDPEKPGTAAHGLVATGQVSREELEALIGGCERRAVGLLEIEFPLSRHLPPGWYDNCLILRRGNTPPGVPFCRAFRINAVTGYAVNVSGLDFGVLTKDVESVVKGDFDMATLGAGTIVNTGNTSPVFAIEFSWMQRNAGPAAVFIKRNFGVEVSRRDAAGSVIALQRIAGIAGGRSPAAPDPFAGSTRTILHRVCLEPGEPLRLDFSVTPGEAMAPGTYSGKMRVSVQESPACVAGLGRGEGATGDIDNNASNNVPGIPVSQENLHPRAPG